jgi:hypothetical protein
VIEMTSYCSVEDVKRYSQIVYSDLGFSDDNEFSNFISNTIIPRASSIVDSYCGHDFLLHSVTEKYDGNGTYVLTIRNAPIVSVSYVKKDGEEIDPSEYYAMKTIIVFKQILEKGFQNYEVSYSYGYSSIPEVIKDVTARICANMLQYCVMNKMGPLIRQGEFKLMIPDQAVLTSDLKALLEPFKIGQWRYA